MSAALVALAACGAPGAPSQAGEVEPVPAVWADSIRRDDALEAGRFVVVRGRDTLSVEEFRHGRGYAGSLVRVRGGPTLRFEGSLSPDARVDELAIRLWPASVPGVARGPLDLLVSFAGASVAVQRAARGGGRTTERRDVRPGTLPWTAPSIVLLELIVRRARGAGLSVVPLYDAVGGGATLEAFVSRLGADSVLVRVGAEEYRVAVDAAGRLLGGRVSPGGKVIRRDAASAP